MANVYIIVAFIQPSNTEKPANKMSSILIEIIGSMENVNPVKKTTIVLGSNI